MWSKSVAAAAAALAAFAFEMAHIDPAGAGAASGSFPEEAKRLVAQASDPFEIAFWNSIADSSNPADYEAYLEAFPEGAFAPLARARIDSLRGGDADPSLSTAGAAIEGGTEALYEVVRRANVREAPSGTAERITRLEAGSRVQAVAAPIEGNWYEVTLDDGRRGYVVGDVLRRVSTPTATSPATTTEPEPVPAAAVAATVGPPRVALIRRGRLREAPSATAERLARLAEGSEVEILGRVVDSDWYYVETMEGDQGFLHTSFFAETDLDVARVDATGEPAEPTDIGEPVAPSAGEVVEPAVPATASGAGGLPSAEGSAPTGLEETPVSEVAPERPPVEEVAPAATMVAEPTPTYPVETVTSEVGGEEPEEGTGQATPELAPPPAKSRTADDRIFRDCPKCPEMVRIPAGRFTMGSSNGDVSERPTRAVVFDEPYAIGRYEVSVEEWNACVEDGGCAYRPSIADTPAEETAVRNVSWTDAREYVEWLKSHTGKAYRLPTEAEWEYAARAGTTTRFWWGDDVGQGNADCRDCGGAWQRRSPAPIGSMPANDFGLFDTSGGVWEWVSDCWHPSFVGAPVDGSSWEKDDCRVRVLRGGSWRNDANYARSASRFKYDADVRYLVNGLRVARDLP